MKLLSIIALLMVALPAATQSREMTVKDWDAMPNGEQDSYIIKYVNSVAPYYAREYHVTPETIRGFFYQPHATRNNPPPGIHMVIAGAALLKQHDKFGNDKIDLSKFTIEDLVRWAMDMKFKGLDFPKD